MTRQRQTAARPAIPLATINQMLASAFGLVALDPDHPPDGQTGQREAATALLLELCPRDAVQDTQAVRMVAGHYATMDCLRRAGLRRGGHRRLRTHSPRPRRRCRYGRSRRICSAPPGSTPCCRARPRRGRRRHAA
jgi:hypothetical protein